MTELPPPYALGLPPQFTAWRPSQEYILSLILDAPTRFVAINAPTGAGKSICYMAAGILHGGRAVVLTANKNLMDQLYGDYQSLDLVDVRGRGSYPCKALAPGGEWAHLGAPSGSTCDDGPCHAGLPCSLKEIGCEAYDRIRTAKYADLVSTNYALWMALHRYSQGLGEVDLLILDECFPAGTRIGDSPIETIQIGQSVPSYDPVEKALVDRKVVRRFVRRPTALVRITTLTRSVVATPNHPFLTPDGWQPAGGLHVGSLVLCSTRHGSSKGLQVRQTEAHQVSADPADRLRVVSGTDDDHGRRQALCVSEGRTGVLLPRVREGWTPEILTSPCRDRRRESPIESPDARAQSHARPGDSGEDARLDAAAGLRSGNPGWQRSWSDSSGTGSGLYLGLADQRDCTDWSPSAGIPDPLQDRHRQSDAEDRDRGRWPESQCVEPEAGRQEEGSVLEWTRVDRVEVLEQGRDGTYGGLCPDGLVYNLEVEGTHTYLANGFVIHNCHQAPDALADALKISLSKWLCHTLDLHPLASGSPIQHWVEWAAYHEAQVRERLESLEDTSPTGKTLSYRKWLRQGAQVLWAMKQMDGVNWIEDSQPDAVVFEILHPARYNNTLFQGAGKVVLLSATLTKKTLALLGIPQGEVTWWEAPSTFPVHARRVTYVPTVKVDYRMTPAHEAMLAARVDQYLSARPTRKGIIHTVSYARAKKLYDKSAYKGRMRLHAGGDKASDVVTAFRKSTHPEVLVSPAMDMGIDLPDDQCRFTVILKLPFPSTQSKIVQARAALDPEYVPYLMCQRLEQSVGRDVRHQGDWSEHIVVDDNFRWAWGKYKHLLTKGFRDAVVWGKTLPAPYQP